MDSLKAIASVLKEAHKIEQYQQILDVQGEVLAMQGEVLALREENRVLKEKMATMEAMVFNRNCYWNKETDEGPFCSRCLDVECKAVRMQPCGSDAFFNCPNCKNSNVLVYPEKRRERVVRAPLRNPMR